MDTDSSQSKAVFTWESNFSQNMGSDIKYAAGTSTSVSASADSKISSGVSWSVNLAAAGGSMSFYESKTSLQFAGASFGMTEAYQKTHQDVFSVSVGSTKPVVYWTLRILAVLATISQATALLYAPKPWIKVDEDDVKKMAAAGAFNTSIYAGLAGPLLATLAVLALHINKSTTKLKLINKSKATLSISKNARAFIGVQDTNVGGASGLKFNRDEFELLSFAKNDALAFSNSGFGSGDTSYVRHGWEVVGFKDPDKDATRIKGSHEKLEIKSKDIDLETNDKSRITMRGSSINIASEGENHNSRVDIYSKGVTMLQAGTTKEAGKISLSDSQIKMETGALNIVMMPYDFNLSGLNDDQNIHMNKSGIEILHGRSGISLSNSGLDLCNGAIKIMNRSVRIPDIKRMMAVQQNYLKKQLEDRRKKMQELMENKISKVKSNCIELVDRVTRDVEAKLQNIK